jgi:gas vesicle protein
MGLFGNSDNESPKEKAQARLKKFVKINYAVRTLKESAELAITSESGYQPSDIKSKTHDEMNDEHERVKSEIMSLRGRIQRGRSRALGISKGFGKRKFV